MTTATMTAATGGATPSRGATVRTWSARGATGLVALFLASDGATKFADVAPVREAMAQLGYADHHAPVLGTLLLACLALHLVPRTAVLGAVLLTAYLGGAVAAHVRVDNPLLSHTLVPVYMAVLLWGGLCGREPRLASLLLLRHVQEDDGKTC
jgi:hypothetical protein